MPKYDSSINTAYNLIKKKGAPVTLARHVDGGFDPVNQVETTPTDSTSSGQAVRLPPGKSAEVHIGTLVGRNIGEFYIAEKGMTLRAKPGDKITFAGEDWAVIWAQTYDPAGDGAILTKAYAER